MTEVSNGPQFHTFELTANKYRITFMQPPGGPQKSANLQYSEAPTLRSIESDIKRETEEQNPIIETCHQAFHHELPSRSLSDRSLAGPTSMDPVYESSRHFEASKALLPPCPFDPAQNEDEDKEDSEIQVMNSTVGDEGDFAHMTSDSGDDETVVAESPAHYQDDPSPSPSPNSPLIGSPTGVASPEPIKYTWEDSENEQLQRAKNTKFKKN
ncbi:uncharacterized protein J3D65DRAFT_673148 [Phyllosticta citribraziliensis]|uniref:Uncharacterized protein n=1 Tax=Phyllosticta citribraziliensis TaxID=989973 RepID=A0ABR1M956_9PEZI